MIIFEIAGIIIIGYIIHYFFFNIYETKAEYKLLNKDNGLNTYVFNVKLINAVGYEIPFRKADFEIEVVEGIHNIKKIDNSTKSITIYDRRGTKITVKIKCEYSIAQELLTIYN
ncbi:MAG TPA: hypothetical protein PL041_12890 [Melioribacteraceae bacterium]|nr:hypothetical protein [Melioribacteraceae bacterium]